METDHIIVPIVKLVANHPRREVCDGLLSSLQPVVRPVNLNFQWKIEGQKIFIQSSPWGDIGFLILKDLAPSRVEILFFPSIFHTQQETEQVEFAIRTELLNNRLTNGDMVNNREQALKNLADALHGHRQSLLVKVRDWLASALGIWGLIEYRPAPYVFSFVIDGTPAQFAIMLRYFFLTYRSPDGLKDLEVKVMRSNSIPLQEISPPDINPILVEIIFFRRLLGITVHTMPNMRSLLRVELADSSVSWSLWDAIRNEMARVCWFQLPEVPESLLAVTDEVVQLQTVVKSSQEPWLLIPDTGNDQLVVQLWNQKQTSKEIGQKVGSSEKTILNRINELRKQFGPQIVPYRKVRRTMVKKTGK